MLVGSGVGSVATVASQQVIFAAAPISALLLLNLLNHRRIEKVAQETTAISMAQLDQKFSYSIFTLQQQVQALPSALNLANLRKDLQSRNQETYSQLLQSIRQLQQEGMKPEWRLLPQEVDQLKAHYYSLENSLAGVRESFSRINPSLQLEGVEGEIAHLRESLAQLHTHLQGLGNEQKLNHYRVLQDQVNHINRRLNKLPAPFDASALKQDVDTLIKHMGDMATRRDLSRLEAQMERVTHQGNVIEQSLTPLRVVGNILKKQVDTVVAKVSVLEATSPASTAITLSSHADTDALKETVSTLEQRLNQVPTTSDLRALRTDMEAVVSTHLGQLQQQLDTVERQTQDLEHQQQNLRDWVHRLPQLLDSSAVQNEVKYLATRVEWAESTMAELQTQVETTRNPPRYEWVMDVQRLGQGSWDQEQEGSQVSTPLQISRYLLEQAFNEAQARLIVVFPFPTPEILNQAMIQRFRQFLDQNGCLDIGWGHLGNGNLNPAASPSGISPWEARSLLSIDRQRAAALNEQSFLFTLLNQLTELKKQHPDRFRFKVLGTNESFLVGDRAFALLASSAIATTSVVFPAATLGIRTTDPEVIQRLVERFDHPEVDGQDIAAYFNRAATRYDLGDRQGAISDYSEVLTLDPTDEVAYNNRGLARYDVGDKEGAIADFAAAVQHNPQNVTAYCNLGYVRSELGDKSGAIDDYNRALQLNPRCVTAYFYRGLARTRLQNRQGAIADYTEVLRLTPDDASAHFYRGLAYAKLNHYTEAIRDLRRAAQLFAVQGDDANYQQTANAIRTLVSVTNFSPLVREKLIE